MQDSGAGATAFLDEFRTGKISELLVAAVTAIDVGAALEDGPLEFAALAERLNLQTRPAIVLLTALRSIELIDIDSAGRIALTAYGREKMAPSSPLHLRGYVGLGAHSADVQHMVQCLLNDRPAGEVSYVYHDGVESALDDQESSDLLTRAMADRARNVAPALAQQLDVGGAKHLIDVGGGHGIYSLALLEANPGLRATIIDRAPPLQVAAEYAEAAGLTDRVTLCCENAHTATEIESPDLVLMANLLHDYDVDDAANLVRHYAQQLPPGGRLMVLDSLLESIEPGQPPVSPGPRAVAAYSALLFSICEGRCYRLDEIEQWLADAGLVSEGRLCRLPAHGSVVAGRKAVG